MFRSRMLFSLALLGLVAGSPVFACDGPVYAASCARSVTVVVVQVNKCCGSNAGNNKANGTNVINGSNKTVNGSNTTGTNTTGSNTTGTNVKGNGSNTTGTNTTGTNARTNGSNARTNGSNNTRKLQQ